MRDHHKHGVGLQYQKLFFRHYFKILLTSFNSNMKSTRQIKTYGGPQVQEEMFLYLIHK